MSETTQAGTLHMRNWEELTGLMNADCNGAACGVDIAPSTSDFQSEDRAPLNLDFTCYLLFFYYVRLRKGPDLGYSVSHKAPSSRFSRWWVQLNLKGTTSYTEIKYKRWVSTGWWELRHLPLKHSGKGLKIANVSIRPVSRTPAVTWRSNVALLFSTSQWAGCVSSCQWYWFPGFKQT